LKTNQKVTTMHPTLRHFIRQYLGFILMALLPVILTAFLSMPLSLGGHPGEARAGDAPIALHLT